MFNKGNCDKWFIWSPSNCKCEYDKVYDIEEYLSCKKCKYRKELVDRLVEESTENVDEKEFYPAKLH